MTRLYALAAISLFCAGAATADDGAVTRYANGLWFDGAAFVERTVFVADGVLSVPASRNEARRMRADETVDLAGGFVTPPFCEAHNHNLGSDWQNDYAIARYLWDGVFYVKILSNLPRELGYVRHTYNRPDSVDAMFANGGITGPGGHPIRLRERLLSYGAYEGFTKETLKDHAYFVIDSDEDIEEKWPLVLQFRPDFIKLFLVFSEEYEIRRDDPFYFGQKGLNPDVFRKLVARAHDHGLRVSVHVNSAYDFHIAVDAGADEIAHLPGRRAELDIDPADARMAAEKGIVVVATTQLVEQRKDRDPELYVRLRAKQKQNLQLLKDAGVTLAVGSDEYDDTSLLEIASLRDLDLFDEAELLRMWTENCTQTIFPGRKIGRLADGYEASFLVLEGDPLADFDATRRISMRVKEGGVLDVQEPAPPREDDQ